MLNNFNIFIIYGIGIKTTKLLEKYADKVYGLMDSKTVGGTVNGKKILSEREVVESGVKTIVIAARQANVPIIYRRIACFCAKNSIACYDDNGALLKEKEHTDKLNFEIANLNEIKNKIINANVVSFDVFDTLVMRKCLYPDDVFEIAGNNDCFETEFELACGRKELFEIYNFAKEKGKEIFFVSDMYLTSKNIQKILQKCGIETDSEKILVSCEQGKSKTDGLFEILKIKCNDKKIFHIGDSYEADCISAKQYGVDSIKIESRLEKLQNSEYSNILKYDTNLENRLVIAQLLISNFNTSDLLSPLIYKFVDWLKGKAKNFNYVLLGARDGYLINLIESNFEKFIYFLTSRVGAVRSDSANYLKYIDSLKIPQNANVAFMDFVSAGTCYNALKDILPFEISGLFAIKIGETDSKIQTLYENYENSYLYKNYFLLEETLCSDKPTLKGFDENGQPLYFEEKRTEKQLLELKKLQKEILEYRKRVVHIDFNEIDINLCDYIFGMCKEQPLAVEDEFYGR